MKRVVRKRKWKNSADFVDEFPLSTNRWRDKDELLTHQMMILTYEAHVKDTQLIEIDPEKQNEMDTEPIDGMEMEACPFYH